MKRFLDIAFSLAGLIVLSPVFAVIAVVIKFGSEGPVIFRQSRVGRLGKDFELLKFRTMSVNADSGGLLTVGNRDPRITGAGYYLRKYKLDELPQLVNVLKGEMSFVGPRPEVRKYVEMYNDDQKKVLSVRPGITDEASILYRNENEILSNRDDPEAYYIEHIMPDKIRINLEYIQRRSVFKDIKVILSTIGAIVSGNRQGVKIP